MLLRPCEDLRPWICGYAIHHSEDAGHVQAVLPGVQPVMGFQFRGRMSTLLAEGEVLLETSGVTGLQGQLRQYRSLPGTSTLLIYFQPWGAAAFLPVPMDELTDLSLGLSMIWSASDIRTLESRLCESTDDAQRIQAVEAFLRTRLHGRAPDGCVRKASRLLLENPSQGLSDLAKSLNLGERQLERKFKEWIGMSPKLFARLARFQKSVSFLEKGREPKPDAQVPPDKTFPDEVRDLGFYDQAHFIKDFRTWTGMTPAAWLRRQRNVGYLQGAAQAPA